jgi:glutamate N-acetyltransferase/amino-acid N-acetyltransferase
MDQQELHFGSVPLGFRWGAVRAGIKASGNPDLACAVMERPAGAAAMFTRNQVVAAPVTVGRRHLERAGGRMRVVVVNAGNANCATGAAGVEACAAVCAAAAERWGCAPHEVFPSSTGVIGVPLPAEKLVRALPDLEASLGSGAEHLEGFARAIMTTDTRLKTASAELSHGERTARLAGVAKGAGMIHPQLQIAHATMLVYLFTDVAAEPEEMTPLLERAVERSFNRISVDGDTSTNDTVLLLASGGSGVKLAEAKEGFTAALEQVCISLAKQIVADGEGVTHVVELEIRGAASEAEALTAAKAIAHSPLVKTAWAGSDPNWGRLIAAVGYSGARVAADRIAIDFGDLAICRGGMRAADYDEAAAHAYLSRAEFTVRVDLGVGEGCCRFWTTDLTAEYVRINADYGT